MTASGPGLGVRISAGGEQYALPVTAVLELATGGEVTPVPGAGAHVLGVRNLRGQVVVVIDLARALSAPDRADPTHVVVVETGGRRAALAVDGVFGVGSLPDCSEQVDSELLAGAGLIDGALVGVLDVEAVLDAATTGGDR